MALSGSAGTPGPWFVRNPQETTVTFVLWHGRPARMGAEHGRDAHATNYDNRCLRVPTSPWAIYPRQGRWCAGASACHTLQCRKLAVQTALTSRVDRRTIPTLPKVVLLSQHWR